MNLCLMFKFFPFIFFYLFQEEGVVTEEPSSLSLAFHFILKHAGDGLNLPIVGGTWGEGAGVGVRKSQFSHSQPFSD